MIHRVLKKRRVFICIPIMNMIYVTGGFFLKFQFLLKILANSCSHEWLISNLILAHIFQILSFWSWPVFIVTQAVYLSHSWISSVPCCNAFICSHLTLPFLASACFHARLTFAHIFFHVLHSVCPLKSSFLTPAHQSWIFTHIPHPKNKNIKKIIQIPKLYSILP